MKRPRAVLLRLHRSVGLCLAAFLLVAGPTGSIAAFHDALDGWLNPDLFRARSAGPALPLSVLADRLAKQVPNGRLGYLLYRPAPGDTVRAYLQPEPGATPVLLHDEVFLDPVTGAEQGARSTQACCFDRRSLIPFLYRFHYSLGLGRTGILLMGIVSLVWAFDCVVGLLLTLPVRWRPWRPEGWRRWGLAWRIAADKGGIRRVFDLHRALSLWLWIVLLGMAISGVSLNLGAELFRPVVSALLPVTAPVAAADPGPAGPIGLDRAERIATRAAAAHGWKRPPGAVFVSGPDRLLFYFEQVDGRRSAGLGAPVVTLDRRSGRVVQVAVPGQGKAGDTVLDLQFPWHSGEIAGVAGRVAVAITGIVVPVLVVTGLVIWNRKRRPKRRSRRGAALVGEAVRPS